ncbi:MAG: hypothetical protein ACI4S4_04300 [Candidatus Ornithospirochaeta sp.]
MNITQIPREKAESLARTKPFLLSLVTLSSLQSSFLMITRDGVLGTFFDLAVVEDGEIVGISDESLRDEVEKYILSLK